MIREIRYNIAGETLPYHNPVYYARCLTTALKAQYPTALVVVMLDIRHSDSQLIVDADEITADDQVRESIKAFYDHYNDEGTV